MSRVVHFEIDAKKPDRAVSFYEKVFDWKIEKWKGPVDYWLITTGNPKEPGIDGGLAKRTEAEPSTVNTIDVPSVDKLARALAKKCRKTAPGLLGLKWPFQELVGWFTRACLRSRGWNALFHLCRRVVFLVRVKHNFVRSKDESSTRA